MGAASIESEGDADVEVDLPSAEDTQAALDE